VLERIPPLNQRLAVAARPTAKSQAVNDGRTTLGAIPYDLSISGMSIGIDHLMTWYALVIHARTVPAFAHLSSLRSALDGAVMARWLCEPPSQADLVGAGAARR
jgi:hypothetical protein